MSLAKHHEDSSGLLKVVGVLMCIAAIPYIMIGFPLLFILIGIFPLAIGSALLVYGLRIYNLRKDAYVGSMVLWFLALTGPFSMHQLRHPLSFILPLVFIGIIHSYRHLLTK